MLPTTTLGKTNRKVTIFGLGGEGILRTRDYEKQAEAVIKKAIEVGVTYFDTAPAYEQSRDYLGNSLWKYTKRENIFLASKTHDRTYQGTIFLIEDSLKRLKTNYLDLIQLHDLRTNEDLEEIFSENGAIHAVEEARKKGIVKYIGVTGHHDPQILISAIKKYDFDSILICANAGDKHYLPFITTVIPEARKKGMGIIVMKTFAQSHALSAITAKEALYYTLSQDVDLAIIGCRTPQEVEGNAQLVKEFKQLSKEELTLIEEKTSANPVNTNFFKKGMY